HAYATGEKTPKPKSTKKKADSKSSPKTKLTQASKGKRIKTVAKGDKPAMKKQSVTKSKGLTVLSEKSSEDDDDDEVNVSEDNDDDADKDDDADNQDDEIPDDDDEQTDLDNDGDDFVHPKLSTHDDEARKDDEVNEEESDDESNEDSDEEIQGANLEEEEMDEEATHEEDEANELYKDVNINLEGRDTVMTDAPLPNVQGTQVTKDTHVIITAPINPEGIDTIFTPNTEATLLVDVPVTTTAELPLLSATTLPPTPLITHLQQTPVPTPTTVPSSSLQDLPNFGSLYRFDHRLKTLETDFSEFKQTNQFAEAVSSIPGIVDAYLANKMHKADQVKEQVKAHVSKILPKIEKTVNEQLKAEVMTRSSTESKTSQCIVANLSELELKKILIDKMESNKRRDDEDKDKEPFAGSNRGSKRRRAGKEPESTSEPKEKTSKTTGKSTEGSKSHHKSAGESAQAEEHIHAAKELEEPTY
ncbi:hypothetical protein Tco_1147439, partial [Tanacetum coccineum]